MAIPMIPYGLIHPSFFGPLASTAVPPRPLRRLLRIPGWHIRCPQGMSIAKIQYNSLPLGRFRNLRTSLPQNPRNPLARS